MTQDRIEVTGMTCEHCVMAVTDELSALPGVRAVQVELVAGGVSSVTLTTDRQLPNALLSQALDEAGDYQLLRCVDDPH